MHRRVTSIGLHLLWLVALAAAGCAGKLHAPSSADESLAQLRWPGTTLGDLQRGRALYIGRCSSCHALYQPKEYPAQQWRGFVEEMVDRAKLGPTEATAVIRYLVAAAEVTRSAPPGAAVSSRTPATP